jgi:hypothetical protein
MREPCFLSFKYPLNTMTLTVQSKGNIEMETLTG